MSKIPVFTHVVLTAPSHSIAEVYRIQLNCLQQAVPFLSNCTVVCVSDPEHGRVGSGGGTLNALQYLKSVCGVDSFSNFRLLVIHSGGESRRAPLNSLCGKAWTSINATVDGDVLASPLLLLIKELSLFCQNLSLGSLVIASSDVTLDIANESSVKLKFEDNCVFVVAVPVDPSIAKNHGVLVPSNLHSLEWKSGAGGEYAVDQAVQYFQKPSVEKMRANGALFNMNKQTGDTSDASDNDTYALVDTGVVIFSGEALHKLVSLLDDPVVSTCTENKGTDTTMCSAPPTGSSALRLELYTDIMLALALKNQTEFDIAEYHRRLGVTAPIAPSPSSLYEQALPVVWEALRHIPLNVITVPEGKFEHLGTTAEVLQLLTLSDGEGLAGVTSIARASGQQLTKLRAFAQKYRLQKQVKSIVHGKHAASDVFINSVWTESDNACVHKLHKGGVNRESQESHTVIEHSVLSGNIVLPVTAIVSHVCPSIGQDLRLRDGIMMQQVHLKRALSEKHTPDKFSLPCAMIVLGIADDIKLTFSQPGATICGAPWDKLLQVNNSRLHVNLNCSQSIVNLNVLVLYLTDICCGARAAVGSIGPCSRAHPVDGPALPRVSRGPRGCLHCVLTGRGAHPLPTTRSELAAGPASICHKHRVACRVQ